jgi:hypothetical protein
MFVLTKICRQNKNLVDLILQNLSLLSKNIEKYFQSLDVSSLFWARDPFVISVFESAELTLAEEDELKEIRNDIRIKMENSSTDMASFWLSLSQEYTIITEKAIKAHCICVRMASLL